MRKYSYILAGIAIIAAIMACNLPSSQPSQPDPGAVMTAAALTVQAQLPQSTATSAGPAATATFTSVPFPTLPLPTLPPPATATSNCDNAQFVKDVTYPDGTVVTAGDNFTKTWRLKNIGSCSWTPSYALVFISGDSMNGPAVQALTGNINSGQTVDVSVGLTAPSSNGTYTGNWGLRNASGVIFAHFYVQIKVGGGGGPFAVIHVTYTFSTWSDSGHTNCPRVTASITTNESGTVTYHWTRSDGASIPTNTLSFGSAGTQSINYDWALGHVWNGTTSWVGIYIDSPNHQDFGHQTFTTACTSP